MAILTRQRSLRNWNELLLENAKSDDLSPQRNSACDVDFKNGSAKQPAIDAGTLEHWGAGFNRSHKAKIPYPPGCRVSYNGTGPLSTASVSGGNTISKSVFLSVSPEVMRTFDSSEVTNVCSNTPRLQMTVIVPR